MIEDTIRHVLLHRYASGRCCVSRGERRPACCVPVVGALATSEAGKASRAAMAVPQQPQRRHCDGKTSLSGMDTKMRRALWA